MMFEKLGPGNAVNEFPTDFRYFSDSPRKCIWEEMGVDIRNMDQRESSVPRSEHIWEEMGVDTRNMGQRESPALRSAYMWEEMGIDAGKETAGIRVIQDMEKKGNLYEGKANGEMREFPNKQGELGGEKELPDTIGESGLEKTDLLLKEIERRIGTSKGIADIMEKHPEKADLWGSELVALDNLNDPEASPAEIRSAQAKLSILKGQLMETAVKDVLSEVGFDVEKQQKLVEGESGGTRPDVIAKNNTAEPLEAFGHTIQPEEKVSVECKCGCSAYMANQLINHIPNQLSGQEGKKVLLATSDIRNTPKGLAEEVCGKYGANLSVPNVSVEQVEKSIKEAEGR